MFQTIAQRTIRKNGLWGDVPAAYIPLAEYELIADVIVGTATAAVDITGLSLGKSDEILLVFESKHTDINYGSEYALYLNGNTTATNYYTQSLFAGNTTSIAGRANVSSFSYSNPTWQASGVSIAFARIKLTESGYFVTQSEFTRRVGDTVVEMQSAYITSTFTVGAITSLRIAQWSTSGSNMIGIGSRVQLYRIGGA